MKNGQNDMTVQRTQYEPLTKAEEDVLIRRAVRGEA